MEKDEKIRKYTRSFLIRRFLRRQYQILMLSITVLTSAYSIYVVSQNSTETRILRSEVETLKAENIQIKAADTQTKDWLAVSMTGLAEIKGIQKGILEQNSQMILDKLTAIPVSQNIKK